MNIADNMLQINADTLYLQEKLKANLTEKGIEGLADETINQLVDKVPEIPAGSATSLWTRPLDRPVKPVMVDDTILMLFGVGRDSPNDIAFMITCVGGYTVIGADGIMSNHDNNTVAEFMYDYDSIDAPIDSQGYKMCWIVIRPILESGNITALYGQVRHSLRPSTVALTSQVFEMYIQCPLLTTMQLFPTTTSATSGTYFRMMQIFSLDINNITIAFNYLLAHCNDLKLIEKLYVDKMVSVAYFLYASYGFNGEIPSDSGIFKKASSECMSNCISYNQQFQRPFTAVTTYAFTGMSSYNHILELDLANRTTVVTFPTNLYALKGLRLYNMTAVQNLVGVPSTSLDVPALNLLGGDLYDRTGLAAGTLTITGCFGAARWSAEDKAIVTAKNWTIVG